MFLATVRLNCPANGRSDMMKSDLGLSTDLVINLKSFSRRYLHCLCEIISDILGSLMDFKRR